MPKAQKSKEVASTKEATGRAKTAGGSTSTKKPSPAAKKAAGETRAESTAKKTTAPRPSSETSSRAVGTKAGAARTTKAAAPKKAASKKAPALVHRAKAAPARKTPEASAVESGPPASRGNTAAASAGAATATAVAPVIEEPFSDEFLAEQRVLLLEERASYTRSADELKAQADSLALEHEPGDVQFDEEGGEGGTSNVDRELDLVLSAQARAAITEIDRALAKIDAGTYGVCEQCGQLIPQARLAALPYAALCVACKSGGLTRRS
jgi:DnaK suppressor protein